MWSTQLNSGIFFSLVLWRYGLTLAINCMLKGPVTINAWPISKQILRIFLSVSSFRSCGGRTIVASPECTPAFSTCSEMAMITTSPSQATASTSISYTAELSDESQNDNESKNENGDSSVKDHYIDTILIKQWLLSIKWRHGGLVVSALNFWLETSGLRSGLGMYCIVSFDKKLYSTSSLFTQV